MSGNERLEGIGMTSRRTRQRMLERLQAKGFSDVRVLAAMDQIPRHIFVDEALSSRAYEDDALPIGHSQTISQPQVVAVMTSLVIGDGVPPDNVLEIGTGSGYQAAVLSRLVEKVHTVERIEPLVRLARERFFELRLRNVQCKLADGSLGWPENGPFDAIIVTAGNDHVPDPLFAQLADGGRLVAPLGPDGEQKLTVVMREGDTFTATQMNDVRFVPLLKGTQS